MSNCTTAQKTVPATSPETSGAEHDSTPPRAIVPKRPLTAEQRAAKKAELRKEMEAARQESEMAERAIKVCDAAYKTVKTFNDGVEIVGGAAGYALGGTAGAAAVKAVHGTFSNLGERIGEVAVGDKSLKSAASDFVSQEVDVAIATASAAVGGRIGKLAAGGAGKLVSAAGGAVGAGVRKVTERAAVAIGTTTVQTAADVAQALRHGEKIDGKHIVSSYITSVGTAVVSSVIPGLKIKSVAGRLGNHAMDGATDIAAAAGQSYLETGKIQGSAISDAVTNSALSKVGGRKFGRGAGHPSTTSQTSETEKDKRHQTPSSTQPNRAPAEVKVIQPEAGHSSDQPPPVKSDRIPSPHAADPISSGPSVPTPTPEPGNKKSPSISPTPTPVPAPSPLEVPITRLEPGDGLTLHTHGALVRIENTGNGRYSLTNGLSKPTTPIFVNGKPVSPIQEIKPGDTISVGGTRIPIHPAPGSTLSHEEAIRAKQVENLPVDTPLPIGKTKHLGIETGSGEFQGYLQKSKENPPQYLLVTRVGTPGALEVQTSAGWTTVAPGKKVTVDGGTKVRALGKEFNLPDGRFKETISLSGNTFLKCNTDEGFAGSAASNKVAYDVPYQVNSAGTTQTRSLRIYGASESEARSIASAVRSDPNRWLDFDKVSVVPQIGYAVDRNGASKPIRALPQPKLNDEMHVIVSSGEVATPEKAKGLVRDIAARREFNERIDELYRQERDYSILHQKQYASLNTAHGKDIIPTHSWQISSTTPVNGGSVIRWAFEQSAARQQGATDKANTILISVDDKTDPALRRHYDEFHSKRKKEIDEIMAKPPGIERDTEMMTLVSKEVGKIPYSYDADRTVRNRYNRGEAITRVPLGGYIEANQMQCEHHALLVSYYAEKMRQSGHISPSALVRHDRNKLVTTNNEQIVGHGWCRIEYPDTTVRVYDATQDHAGSPLPLKMGTTQVEPRQDRWIYMRPDELQKLIQSPVL